MTLQVVLTKGLPASGKSTWAKDFVKENAGWARVNKDSLRKMAFGVQFDRKREKDIHKFARDWLNYLLSTGWNVIVDDTNLGPDNEPEIRAIARKWGAEVRVQDFTNVPVDECVLRDAGRPADERVGKAVILEMAHKFLAYRTPERKVPLDPSKPLAFICDLDGTLALIHGRDPYDGHLCATDKLNEAVATTYRALQAAGLKAVILSGRWQRRDNSGYEATMAWLKKHGITYDYYEMRPAVCPHAGSVNYGKDCSCRDSILKGEMLARVQEKYNVLLTLDDRNQVVNMWRGEGIPCFQVAPGDF